MTGRAHRLDSKAAELRSPALTPAWVSLNLISNITPPRTYQNPTPNDQLIPAKPHKGNFKPSYYRCDKGGKFPDFAWFWSSNLVFRFLAR